MACMMRAKKWTRCHSSTRPGEGPAVEIDMAQDGADEGGLEGLGRELTGHP